MRQRAGYQPILGSSEEKTAERGGGFALARGCWANSRERTPLPFCGECRDPFGSRRAPDYLFEGEEIGMWTKRWLTERCGGGGVLRRSDSATRRCAEQGWPSSNDGRQVSAGRVVLAIHRTDSCTTPFGNRRFSRVFCTIFDSLRGYSKRKPLPDKGSFCGHPTEPCPRAYVVSWIPKILSMSNSGTRIWVG